MSDNLTSLDEFLSDRKDFVKSGDVLVKASRAASSWDAQKRSIRFTMSAEVEDRDRDIVHQKGLNIEEFLKNPIAFYNHRSYEFPVGTWSDLAKVSGKPRRTEGTLTLVPEGTEALADQLARHLDAGSIKACSIGFIPKAVRKREIPDDKKDSPYFWPGYEILEAELVECSPCTVPSNPAALAKAARDGDVIAKELIEMVLDTWATDPVTGLLMPRKDFEEAYKVASADAKGITIPVITVPAEKLKGVPHSTEERFDVTHSGAEEPEHKGFLDRLFKLFGSKSDEEIQREIAAREAEEAEAAAAAEKAAQNRAARKAALAEESQSTLARIGEKGLTN